jgi:hypothetical protein
VTSTPPTQPLDLDEIEGRAAALYEYATVADPEGQAALDHLADIDVPALLAEVHRLRAELAEYEVLNPQQCPAGKHADWLVDSEHTHACPWCEIDRQRALVAAVTAVHERGEHNGLAICLHCASQMFPPPETGIWSESAYPCATLRALGITDEQPAAPVS